MTPPSSDAKPVVLELAPMPPSNSQRWVTWPQTQAIMVLIQALQAWRADQEAFLCPWPCLPCSGHEYLRTTHEDVCSLIVHHLGTPDGTDFFHNPELKQYFQDS
jgi:hypothetical protein